MIARGWRLLALWLSLWLALAWVLAGCAQASTPIPRATPASAPTAASGASGLRVIVRMNCPGNLNCGVFSTAFSQTMSALVERARRGLGDVDATTTALSDGDIQIDLPGYADRQLAVSALTAQGAVRFIDTSGTPLAVGTKVAANQYPVLFTGAQIAPSSVQATLDQNNQPIVIFEFQGNARTEFATYTRDNQGGYLTITLDNVVIESAQIQSEIDSQGEITGSKTMTDAEALAVELRSVPLPDRVSLVSAESYSG